MKFFLPALLLLCLALPADAARKRKRKAGKRRAPIVRPCPPSVVRIIPDSVEVITQSEEAALQAAIAAWMQDQPEMSEAARNKAREVAEFWFRRGKRAGKR